MLNDQTVDWTLYTLGTKGYIVIAQQHGKNIYYMVTSSGVQALRSAGPALQVVLMDLAKNSKIKQLRNMLRKPKPAERDRMLEIFGTWWGVSEAFEAADSIGGDYGDGGDDGGDGF